MKYWFVQDMFQCVDGTQVCFCTFKVRPLCDLDIIEDASILTINYDNEKAMSKVQG